VEVLGLFMPDAPAISVALIEIAAVADGLLTEVAGGDVSEQAFAPADVAESVDAHGGELEARGEPGSRCYFLPW
jgi:hypothetical protein